MIVTHHALEALEDAKVTLDIDTGSFGHVLDAIRNAIPDGHEALHHLLDTLEADHQATTRDVDLLLQKVDDYFALMNTTMDTVMRSREVASAHAHAVNAMLHSLVMLDPHVVLFLKREYPQHSVLLETFEESGG